MEALRKLALLFLLLFIFAVPTDGLWFIAGISLVKIAGLLLFGVVALLLISGDSLRGSVWFLTAVAVYIAWVWLSFLWTWMPVNYDSTLAMNSQQSLKTSRYLLMLVLLSFQVLRTQRDLDWAFAAYLLGAIGLMYFLIRGYNPNSTTVRHEITGFDANETALQLAIGLPMATYLLLVTRSLALRGISLVYIPLALFAILITGSRTGFITALLGFIGIIPWVWRAKLAWKLAGLVFFITVVISIINFIPQKTLDRVFSSGTELSQGTLSARSITWSRAWLEIQESPFIGAGLGSFRRVINKYNIDYTAHNSYIAITTEQGFIGLFFYLSIIFIVLTSLWKIPPEKRYFMLAVALIAISGQFTLTLQEENYIWLVYIFVIIQAEISVFRNPILTNNYQLKLA